jgi:signal transduction histidine kinase/ActR/RegA family two-component response regulator
LERHSGKPADAVLGRHLFDVFPDLLDRSLDRYYRQALEGQAGILSQRFHNYLLPLPPTVSDSSLMHMQQTARISSVMEGNEVRGTLTLIEDVTERVLAEQELRQQAKRLEDANRHKDEFLAMLAHELRNPLVPIRNGVYVLDRVTADSEEAKKTRVMIQRQVTHMARLIDDLLDVSRIVRGKVRLQKEPCDLIAILREVAQDYEPILADNGLTLSLQLPTQACWIEGDGTRLSQIVSNLLHNANKFTNQGGKVHLSAEMRANQNEVVITVADNGIGMSPETVSKVFDAFTQAESSLARSKGGLGLGLTLAKGLAELHDGRMEAFSPGVGMGSTFRVRLPVKNLLPKTPTQSPSPSPAGRNVRRVLIIEDNRDTAISMKILLEHLGLDVVLAFSGLQGVEVARSGVPDAVLCDIGLPGLDGLAVARALRSEAKTRDVFLIAQSGYGQADDIRKAREAGFDLHLTKPVTLAELERVLKQASGANHEFTKSV